MQAPSIPERCLLRVWYRPQALLKRKDLTLSRSEAEHPELIGSWNQFARPGLRQFERRQASDGTDWWTASLPLQAGSYSYGFVVGPYLLPDDRASQSEFRPNPLYLDSGPYEAEFSVTELPDCDQPTLTVQSVQTTPSAKDQASGQLKVQWLFAPGQTTQPLQPSSVKAQLLQHDQAPLSLPITIDAATEIESGQRLTLRADNLAPGKYQVELQSQDLVGRASPNSVVQVLIEPRRSFEVSDKPQPLSKREDTVIYHLLIDRFRGPQGALKPPTTPGRRAGGTLAGVQAAVEAGYFQRLGITTLWLSPLYENAPGLQRGRDGNLYEAYHGYWPAQPRAVEPQLGGAAALQALVHAAHKRGLRVLFDAVPNHLFRNHPYFLEHSRQSPSVGSSPNPDRDSWFHDGPRACVCGSPGCGWGERLEDCWFDSYLPDLNWRHPEVTQTGVADLLWWMQTFDLDGMRIDAVPMMPRAATRRMVRSVESMAFRSGLDLLVLGENYTGPGDEGRAIIRAFLGSRLDGLHSAFDFPLMWALRAALASDQLGLDALETEIAKSRAAYAGSGAVMATLLGNHDTPRFLSEATGSAGNDPWQQPPTQPAEAQPYRRQLMGLAMLLTLPGIPVLYYGDELGMAGANDPDSRRPLPEILGSALPEVQAELLRQTGRIGRLRACLPALRRGQRQPLTSDRDSSVALHLPPPQENPAEQSVTNQDPVIVVLLRASSDRQLTVTGLPAGLYRDVLSGATLSVPVAPEQARARINLLAKAESAAIYVPANSQCWPGVNSAD